MSTDDRQIISVLDKGFVELVDVMGTDLTVVNAARVSFGKSKQELDTSDINLLKYLAKHKHYSPFRHNMLQLRIKAPEVVMRQLYKHVVGIESTSSYPTKDHGFNELCIAGDTRISIESEFYKSLKASMSISRLYDLWHNDKFDKTRKFYCLDESTNTITLSTAKNICKAGNKEVYKIMLSNQESIETTLDHKFLSINKNNYDIPRWNKIDDILLISKFDNSPYSHCMFLRGIYLATATPNNEIEYLEVVEVKYVGVKECYDIEMDNPHHNFIANSCIVHNSRRYVAVDDFYIPDLWRLQSDNNKQASRMNDDGTPIVEASIQPKAKSIYNTAIAMCTTAIKQLLDLGVAKEQAQMLLPLSFYTEVYWTASLQAIANLVMLRDANESQWEIRQYAKAIYSLAFDHFPLSLTALLEE